MVYTLRLVHIVLLFSNMNSRDSQPSETTPVNGDMVKEADRIKYRIDSFQGWCGKKTPTQLAIAGFRYTGLSDKVICDTCGLKLYNWLEKDNPVQTHKLHSPDCSFIKKWFSSQETSTGNPNTQASLPPPRYPNYSTYEERVDSFYGWPCKHEHQSPSCMAQQGFFYIGSADRVSCFQCGLRLRDWDECDYPSDCHREWSPDCPFINKNSSTNTRPIQGVEDPSSKVPYDTADTSEGDSDTALAGATSATDNSPTEAAPDVQENEDTLNVDPQNNDSTAGLGNTASSSWTDDQPDTCRVNWSSPRVQAVLEMGCERKLVELVTTEHFKNTGQDFPNAAVLYEAILAVESSTI
ncbi:baculoviral IAP repeat-containing protein 2-like [Gigantopelta aegis]|uniref:baculoviral IAP repeat-containing protein 2-like n=1 Tax=Gigantopelta aegis TaxID=1735272 RepID=UPI001B88B63D|nr:baculoviral IAP repeat-containing protein 2-like [Gigantopelta aegis]